MVIKKIHTLVTVISLLLLTACNGSGQANGNNQNTDTLKIGALFPLSGDLALLGEESYRGVELAIEQRNENKFNKT